MRLQKQIINKLKSAVQYGFGDVDVYLFGSRADDSKRGGDIDIAIDSDLSRDEFRKNKVKAITYLTKIGFEFPIDIVNYNSKDELLKNEILLNGQKLF